MENDKKCFFCNNKCDMYDTPNHHLLNTYQCDYCGEYILPKPGLSVISNSQDISKKFKIACILNERRLKGQSGVALSNKTDKENQVCSCPQISVEDILEEFPKKASDFLNRSLLNLSRLPERPFGVINFDTANEGDRLILFSPDRVECFTFLRELEEQGFIRSKPNSSMSLFSLTTKFWEIVENLQKTEVGNKRAFVAMWFNKSMDDYYQNGIKKAIEDAGYDSIRIDLRQDFNGKICDEIIAEIKRSKFLVADFSDMRSGVFFEAGFGKGLGREVICTIRETDKEKLKEHFDTRQYSYIVYDSPEDLRKKLYNRICATIV